MGDHNRILSIYYDEIVKKRRLYAWSKDFSNKLELIASKNSDKIGFEAFEKPRVIDGLATPAIAVAYMKETKA